jgi:hypothetical protein
MVTTHTFLQYAKCFQERYAEIWYNEGEEYKKEEKANCCES